MCSTCGCSDDTHIRVTDLDVPLAGSGAKDLHAHLPAGGHTHEHSHTHDAVGHSHPSSVDLDVEATAHTLRLEQEVLAKNNRLAQHNRSWFEERGIVALNLMSSPGAGKTTLLERTIRDRRGDLTISVVEGDQATARDGERIRATGCRVVQINTGSGCHLDADMVARAVRQLDPPLRSLVLIENIGNLVCPALFDLGEQTKVVIMSVTEGEDKPLKYPHMFRRSELMVLSKTDLLPHLQFDTERCLGYARQVNPRLSIMQLSAQSGDGLGAWYAWLQQRVTERAAVSDGRNM